MQVHFYFRKSAAVKGIVVCFGMTSVMLWFSEVLLFKVFHNQTKLAIMPVLASEALLHENKKI